MKIFFIQSISFVIKILVGIWTVMLILEDLKADVLIKKASIYEESNSKSNILTKFDFSRPLSNFSHLEIIGDSSSNTVWIYLCGVTRDFFSEEEVENRMKLNRIGKKVGVKFLAIKPIHRCKKFENKLCWPHDDPLETIHTYQEIRKVIGDRKPSGYIGFSNGGYFLNQLAQVQDLNAPIISIGSGGHLGDAKKMNTIYLAIGTKDIHLKFAKQFQEYFKKTLLKVHLIKYNDGHILPEGLLEKLIRQLTGNLRRKVDRL